MKKLTALLLVCMTFVCAAVSCGSSEEKASEKNTAEKQTAADDAEAETTTLSKTLDEMSERVNENIQKQAAEAKEKYSEQFGNTDEMEVDAKAVVKQFVEAAYGHDAEAAVAAMYPPEMAEAMKSTEDYDDLVDSISDDETSPLTKLDIKFCVRMKADETALAESYMNYYAKEYGLGDNKYKVTEGYSFSADMESRTEDGVSSDMEQLIIVNIENEGWKIIPISLSDLTE